MKLKYVARKGIMILLCNIIMIPLYGFTNNEQYSFKLHEIEEIKAMNAVLNSVKDISKTEYHSVELNKKKEIQLKEEQKKRIIVYNQSIKYTVSEGCLNPYSGVFYGPSGKETYYNLDMSGVIAIMRGMGNNDEYWIREDGVKMLGNYVMVACHLGLRPRGSLIETSLGTGIVCDTGGFANYNPMQIDVAVNW